mgnify:CR=1 FL=1|tara:strand:- start:484 stop:1404 length:921 start_codon:yes stop_codon:yes gene_type:complete
MNLSGFKQYEEVYATSPQFTAEIQDNGTVVTKGYSFGKKSVEELKDKLVVLGAYSGVEFSTRSSSKEFSATYGGYVHMTCKKRQLYAKKKAAKGSVENIANRHKRKRSTSTNLSVEVSHVCDAEIKVGESKATGEWIVLLIDNRHSGHFRQELAHMTLPLLNTERQVLKENSELRITSSSSTAAILSASVGLPRTSKQMRNAIRSLSAESLQMSSAQNLLTILENDPEIEFVVKSTLWTDAMDTEIVEGEGTDRHYSLLVGQYRNRLKFIDFYPITIKIHYLNNHSFNSTSWEKNCQAWRMGLLYR